MLRLKGGEFAIGMWVASELAHLLVISTRFIRGETGTSLIELNIYSIGARRAFTYWSALGAMFAILAIVFWLLRSPLAQQSGRPGQRGGGQISGVRVASAKRLVFTLAAFGAALAGALWVATALTFQPRAYFSPLWTAYMIFMALVGGLGTFEGAILGAIVFFSIEAWFGSAGVWYLVGLGRHLAGVRAGPAPRHLGLGRRSLDAAATSDWIPAPICWRRFPGARPRAGRPYRARGR